MTKAALSAEVVRQLLRYDAETGKLFWKQRPRQFFKTDRDCAAWNTLYAEAEALCGADADGYLQGTILGRKHKAHRVAWLIQTGEWPSGQIDHENGVRADNRFGNLRIATPVDNQKNRCISINNTTGVTGVHFHQLAKKWVARIGVGGRSIHLGIFHTFEEAVRARAEANARYGFSERHGKSPHQHYDWRKRRTAA